MKQARFTRPLSAMENRIEDQEIEARVCRVADLEDDGKSETMKEVDFDDQGKCLLVR